MVAAVKPRKPKSELAARRVAAELLLGKPTPIASRPQRRRTVAPWQAWLLATWTVGVLIYYVAMMLRP